MAHDPPRILILGETRTAEMRPVAAAVAELAPSAEIRTAASIATAAELPTGESWHPDLVVVCQSWPDEFCEGDVRRLLAAFRLARFVCCFGQWCEADGRTRAIWPHAVRVPARAAGGRIRQELDVLCGKDGCLPLTAARDEVFEFDRSGEPMQALPDTAVIPVSPDGHLRRYWQDLLREAGFQIAAREPGDNTAPAAILWDGDPWSEDRAAALRDLRRGHPGAAIVAAMNFAGPDHAAEVRLCGADLVVPKLVSGGELSQSIATAVRIRLNR